MSPKKTTKRAKNASKTTKIAKKGPVKAPEHLKTRVSILRKKIKESGFDAFLISFPVDIRYLTGFVGDDSWLLVTARQVYILSDFRFDEEIAEAAPHAKVVMRKKSMTDTAGELMKDLKCETVGFQADQMTVDIRQRLGKACKGIKLKPTTGWMITQRAIKDAWEIASIKGAIKIQQQAYQNILGTLSSGMTEKSIAAALEYEMVKLGADGTSFQIIVAAEPRGSLPHAIPGVDKIRKNKSILIDWGAKYEGYCGDLTRVFALGRMPARIKEIYAIVLEAQEAAIAAIAPGKRFAEIDAVARNIIKDAGYGDRFGHSLGHGIGLEIHEEPRLASMVKGELKPGHVVTVEPGIYLPGVGGVRIEDDVLVTKDGFEVLSDLPKDLNSAMI